MSDSILLNESLKFSLDSINLYKRLVDSKEFVLSKQFLRSATSIGANLREGKYAESKKDFSHKFKIVLKECNETLYWLELIKTYDGNYKEVAGLTRKCNSILWMVAKSIRTCNKIQNS